MGGYYSGQKLVCIKRGPWSNQDLLEQFPVYGQVLTIRSIVRSPICGVAFRFVEIVNEPHHWGDGFGEAAFVSDRFRPVVERETDIGFAHKILLRAQRQLVDAEGGAA